MVLAATAVAAAVRAGDHLARAVVRRREGRAYPCRGNRRRQIDASQRQGLVEVVQRLNRRRLGGGIVGDSRRTDRDRGGGTSRVVKVNTLPVERPGSG